MWNYVESSDPTPEKPLFGAVCLTKNVDIGKFEYSGYGIQFDTKGTISFPSGGFGKNVIVFGVDMSYSVQVDYKKKDILILCKGHTQELDDRTLAAEKKYSINFTERNKNFRLSLNFNGAKSHLFVNGTEIHKFKANNSEINAFQKTFQKTFV